jgi:predicted dehydrogenase
MLAPFINKFVRQVRKISSCSGQRITRHHKYSAEKQFSLHKPINIALIGLGDFSETHIGNLRKLPHLYKIAGICSKTQEKVSSVARRLNVEFAVTDYHKILKNDDIDAVMILTRHDLHVPIAVDAVRADKAVFVEKPLATTSEQLEQLSQAMVHLKRPLVVGYNRRYSNHIERLKRTLSSRRNPVVAHYQINNKNYPRDHWIHGPEGGGVILGHGCHILDMFCHLLDAKIEKVQVARIADGVEEYNSQDNALLNISFDDGSIVNVLNTTMGNKQVPKEHCQIFCDGLVFSMDDYKSTCIYGMEKNMGNVSLDKGHLKELEIFAQVVHKNILNATDIRSIIATTKVLIDVADGLKREKCFTVVARETNRCV